MNCSSLSNFDIFLYPISISISTPASTTCVATKIIPSLHSFTLCNILLRSIILSSPDIYSTSQNTSSLLFIISKNVEADSFFINSTKIFFFSAAFFKICSIKSAFISSESNNSYDIVTRFLKHACEKYFSLFFINRTV